MILASFSPHRLLDFWTSQVFEMKALCRSIIKVMARPAGAGAGLATGLCHQELLATNHHEIARTLYLLLWIQSLVNSHDHCSIFQHVLRATGAQASPSRKLQNPLHPHQHSKGLRCLRWLALMSNVLVRGVPTRSTFSTPHSYHLRSKMIPPR